MMWAIEDRLREQTLKYAASFLVHLVLCSNQAKCS